MRQIDWSPAEELMEDLRVLQEKREEIDKQISTKRQEIAERVGLLSEEEQTEIFNNLVDEYNDYSARDHAHDYVGNLDDMEWLNEYEELWKQKLVYECEDEFNGLISPDDSPDKMGEIAKEIASRHPGVVATCYGNNWFFDYE